MLLRFSAVAALLGCSLFLIVTSGSCSSFKMIGKKWPDSTQSSTTQSTQPSTTQSSTQPATQPSTTQSTTGPSTTQLSGTPLAPGVGDHPLRKAAANEPDP